VRWRPGYRDSLGARPSGRSRPRTIGATWSVSSGTMRRAERSSTTAPRCRRWRPEGMSMVLARKKITASRRVAPADRRLAYRFFRNCGEEIVLIDLERRAEYWDRVYRALEATTWQEFRKLMPRDEYA